MNRPAYSAFPTIEPSITPVSASAVRSFSSEIPPEAMTGAGVFAATCVSSSTFGPVSVPSRETSVTM